MVVGLGTGRACSANRSDSHPTSTPGQALFQRPIRDRMVQKGEGVVVVEGLKNKEREKSDVGLEEPRRQVLGLSEAGLRSQMSPGLNCGSSSGLVASTRASVGRLACGQLSYM